METPNKGYKSYSPVFTRREFSADDSRRAKSPIDFYDPYDEESESEDVSSRLITKSENFGLYNYIQKLQSYKLSPSDPQIQTSDDFCFSCFKFKQEIEKLKFQQQRMNDKVIVSEKHLKQFESLLRIKDNRLKEKENYLDKEINNLEKEKIEFEKYNNKLKDYNSLNKINTKQIFDLSFHKEVQCEFTDDVDKDSNSKIDRATNTDVLLESFRKDLDYETISGVIKDKENKLKVQKDALEELANKLADTKKRNEEELRMKYEQFESVKAMLKTKEENIKRKEDMINDDNQRINEEFAAIDELKSILKAQEKNLEYEKECIKSVYHKKIEELQEKLNYYEDKIKSIESKQKGSPENLEIVIEPSDELSFGKTDGSMCSEILKEEFSKSNSLKEKDSLFKFSSTQDRDFDSKDSFPSVLDLSDPQIRKEIFSPKNFENFSTQKIMAIEKVKAKFESKIFELEKQIQIQQEYYKKDREKTLGKLKGLETVNQELEAEVNKLKDQNVSLANSNCNLEIKISKLVSENKNSLEKYTNINNSEQITEENIGNEGKILYYCNELEQQLLKIKEKQEILDTQEKALNNEQELVNSDAHHLKLLLEEFENEKKSFSEEKGIFYQQKAALLELEDKYREKSRLLIAKENELFRLKEQLTEKEKLLSIKGSRVRNYKRLTTFPDTFFNNSPGLPQ
jgi:hypothetical protein